MPNGIIDYHTPTPPTSPWWKRPFVIVGGTFLILLALYFVVGLTLGFLGWIDP
jgi:hypothetical protein